jgi:tetratricopeptide (TPR) repeat protein
MSSVFSLFDILAILYIFRSVQLGLQIWREWVGIRQEPFTAHKKQMANQASYFIAVPIGVLVHEVSHALAVWAAGGQVVEFHYRAFWGYVVPQGDFTSTQTWFIAIAGTLGSLIFGLAIWLIFRRAPSQTLRYFGLRAFRFQVYFSLIYYPLFTLIGFDGDWKTIYDFSATPLLSAGTAVLHLGTLFLFWRGDRSGWFEEPSHKTISEQEQFEQLAAAAALSPQDSQLQVQYIDALRRGGAKNKARQHLQQFLAQNPNSAVGHLELAALNSAGKQQIPKKAAQSAEESLSLGLSDPQQIVYAQEIVGRYYLDMGQIDQAISSLSQAIETLAGDKQNQKLDSLFQLHILRSQAYRRQERFEQAYQDIQEAISYAQNADNQAELNQAQQELETLEKHAGRAFGAAPLRIP